MKVLLVTIVTALGLSGAVDINHATINQLKSLNGIGDSKANEIMVYIEQNGCFKNIEELSNVKGIGKSFILKNEKEIVLTPCKIKDDQI
ncbi:helix-hairpin-helix domain-containing protein [Arcobacteraceae bacterium]|nr:helix-hairpin-helix domain-containing protein [Arcobacteraceae bacterium]